MNVPPHLKQDLDALGPLIDARVAVTGKDRQAYIDYVNRPPRPGQTWEDAIYGRRISLLSGPLPEHAAALLRSQVQASRKQEKAA